MLEMGTYSSHADLSLSPYLETSYLLTRQVLPALGEWLHQSALFSTAALEACLEDLQCLRGSNDILAFGIWIYILWYRVGYSFLFAAFQGS